MRTHRDDLAGPLQDEHLPEAVRLSVPRWSNQDDLEPQYGGIIAPQSSSMLDPGPSRVNRSLNSQSVHPGLRVTRTTLRTPIRAMTSATMVRTVPTPRRSASEPTTATGIRDRSETTVLRAP